MIFPSFPKSTHRAQCCPSVSCGTREGWERVVELDTAFIFVYLFSEHTNSSSQRIENRNLSFKMDSTSSPVPSSLQKLQGEGAQVLHPLFGVSATLKLRLSNCIYNPKTNSVKCEAIKSQDP